MKFYLITLLSFFTIKSYALDIEKISDQIIADSSIARGGWSSGGGNAIVCFKDPNAPNIWKLLGKGIVAIPNSVLDEIESIETFDLYTAKLPRGIEETIPMIREIKSSETLIDYTDAIKARFKDYLSFASDIVQRGQDKIFNENIRFNNNPIIQISDVNEVGNIDQNKCMLTTMALQRNWDSFHELHIDARLFNHPKHSRLSKATLLLHEYVYAVARELNHTDSSATRNLVEYLISFDPSFTINKISKAITGLGFSNKNPKLLTNVASEVIDFNKKVMRQARQILLNYQTAETDEFKKEILIKANISSDYFYNYKILDNYFAVIKFLPKAEQEMVEQELLVYIKERGIKMELELASRYEKKWETLVRSLKVSLNDQINLLPYFKESFLGEINILNNNLGNSYTDTYYFSKLEEYTDSSVTLDKFLETDFLENMNIKLDNQIFINQ